MKVKKIVSFIATGGMCLLLTASVFAKSNLNHAVEPEKQISIYDEKYDTAGLIDIKLLPDNEREILEERTKEIDTYMLKLGKAMAKYESLLDNSKELQSNSNISSNQLNEQLSEALRELKKVDDEGEKMGLVKLSSTNEEKEGKVSILSSYASDFTMDYLNLRYDSKTGMYLLDGQGQWKNKNWKDDVSCALGCSAFQTYNVGGYDGFYLASLHRDIAIFEKKFYTIKSNGTESIEWSHGSKDAGARGIGWKWQDSVYVHFGLDMTYNSMRQLGWMYFKFSDGVPTGSTISFKAETSHTWDKASVNGFSFAPWSIGFSWSNGSQHWEQSDIRNHSF